MSSSNFKSVVNNGTIKVGLLGEPTVGRLALMIKYIEGYYCDDYTQTIGMDVMQKNIHIKNMDTLISIWKLGRESDYTLMPLVCKDAKVVLLAFDLSSEHTLSSIKGWYRVARKTNKTFMPFLIGTKYDLFEDFPITYKQRITKKARSLAEKLNCPLIYCSAAESINIDNIFQLIFIYMFGISHQLPRYHQELIEPIFEYPINYTVKHVQKVTEYWIRTNTVTRLGWIKEFHLIVLHYIPMPFTTPYRHKPKNKNSLRHKQKYHKQDLESHKYERKNGHEHKNEQEHKNGHEHKNEHEHKDGHEHKLKHRHQKNHKQTTATAKTTTTTKIKAKKRKARKITTAKTIKITRSRGETQQPIQVDTQKLKPKQTQK